MSALVDFVKGAFGTTDAALTPVALDRVADLDAKIAHVDGVLKSLAAPSIEVADRISALTAKRNDLLDRAAEGDIEARHEVITAEGEIAAATLEQEHLATMRARQLSKREGLVNERASAQADQHDADLRAAALVELRIGTELDSLADQFAAKLAEFIAAENNCNRLAQLCREPQGTLLSDRIAFALSRHLMPVLAKVGGLGTSIELNVSMERRRDGRYPNGLTFSEIARRPFTPRGEEK